MSEKPRGFASMDRESRREVARKGGRAAHQRGTAHEWTAEEAREAGRKGGGVLLCSGDDSVTSRVDDLATGLDNRATARDHRAHRRSGTTPLVFRPKRQSTEKATDA